MVPFDSSLYVRDDDVSWWIVVKNPTSHFYFTFSCTLHLLCASFDLGCQPKTCHRSSHSSCQPNDKDFVVCQPVRSPWLRISRPPIAIHLLVHSLPPFPSYCLSYAIRHMSFTIYLLHQHHITTHGLHFFICYFSLYLIRIYIM